MVQYTRQLRLSGTDERQKVGAEQTKLSLATPISKTQTQNIFLGSHAGGVPPGSPILSILLVHDRL
jgi:hypothetical protein